MDLLAVPTDSNGRQLIERGTEIGCDIRTLGTSWVPIQFPVDIKGLSIYVVSGTIYIDGTMDSSLAWLDPVAVVNNGNGTVTIAAADHGFAHDGTAEIAIEGTTNYDGTDIPLLAASDEDNLVITATYVAETITAGAYAVGRRYPSYGAGASMEFPVTAERLTTICSLKAATTAVVSIHVWR